MRVGRAAIGCASLMRSLGPPPGQTTARPVLEVRRRRGGVEIVRRYRLRWRIEEVFRALKSDGCGWKRPEMHEAQRLFKLAVVGLATACRTMQLLDAKT